MAPSDISRVREATQRITDTDIAERQKQYVWIQDPCGQWIPAQRGPEEFAIRIVGDDYIYGIRDFTLGESISHDQITALRAKVKELEDLDVYKWRMNALLEGEIEILRDWGNKDCTAMADDAITEKFGYIPSEK